MTTTPADSKLDLLWAEEFDQSAGTSATARQPAFLAGEIKNASTTSNLR